MGINIDVKPEQEYDFKRHDEVINYMAMELYCKVIELELADGSDAQGSTARANSIVDTFLAKFKR